MVQDKVNKMFWILPPYVDRYLKWTDNSELDWQLTTARDLKALEQYLLTNHG